MPGSGWLASARTHRSGETSHPSVTAPYVHLPARRSARYCPTHAGYRACPRAAREDRLDILHGLGNTAPIFVPANVRMVLSLMDVMFLQTGEFVPKPTNRYQAW